MTLFLETKLGTILMMIKNWGKNGNNEITAVDILSMMIIIRIDTSISGNNDRPTVWMSLLIAIVHYKPRNSYIRS